MKKTVKDPKVIIHRQKTHLLDSFDPIATKQSDVDKKIISARLTGDAFGDLDESILNSVYADLLVKIACITGAELPVSESMSKYLVGELDAFLIEFNYAELTEEEILLAFRFNCGNYLRNAGGDYVDNIPLFGKYLSVDYISKVLYNYSVVRFQLDRKLQNFIDGY
jgi:hypothetical protein